MEGDLPIYIMEYDKTKLSNAIDCAFHYMESMDEIVGVVYATPDMMKKIILNFPDEVKLDYIYQGIGTFRTSYMKYLPSVKENSIIFLNQHESFKLKLILL